MTRTGRLASDNRYTTSKAIDGVAFLYLVPGLIFWPINGIKFDLNDCVWIGLCVSCVVLGVWARWMPLPPVIIAIAIFASFVGLQVFQGVPANHITWIIRGAIGLLLLIGIVAANKNLSAELKDSTPHD